MSQQKNKETPLMRQYNAIKVKHPEALLLFRVGDFYETFGEDAIKAAKILGIVLTARNNGSSKLELAGFPHHSLNVYLPKLVRAGLRVAICDQLEDPKSVKGIVKRGVTELVTPGVSFNDQILENKSNNFLSAIHIQNKHIGISFLDISTGEFFIAEGTFDYIEKLIQSLAPKEIIFEKGKNREYIQQFKERHHLFGVDDWAFSYEYCYDTLSKHIGTKNLKGFGIEDKKLGITAAGVTLTYLSENHQDKLQHIASISRIDEDNHVWLDKFTIRNLELFSSQNENAVTLIDIIDHTLSPMGSRLLKRWLALPLRDKKSIDERLNIVDYFHKKPTIQEELHKIIKICGDIERLVSKLSVGKINPREVVQLKTGLDMIEPIKQICELSNHNDLQKIGDQLNECKGIREKIEKSITNEPPVLVSKGNVIQSGISEELDELRKIAYGGKDYLIQLQNRESEKTGITSLKIGFNNVFGYYLEVTHVHKNKVPEDWIRKQTLTNAERYITEELKVYESKILGAEERILALETQLFEELIFELGSYISPIQLNASLIARLDCLLSFSVLAKKNQYIKPEITNDLSLDIIGGRHPVIEQRLSLGDSYVPNDIFLDTEKQQIIMITGPNMSGKSAILRQTALIVLMAQIGCFVPANKAQIGIIDKLFTRVGASDNLSMGESTFMVEMNETASILNNLSDRSLVLLDEIGRGTSTYDGISIAWAIAEYIHKHPHRPKTLFATHYHELNEMAQSFERIKNYNVAVKEIDHKILFLRKLIPGGSEHSFGIHVAKMAGMPNQVVTRASSILKKLEKAHSNSTLNKDEQKSVKIKERLTDMQLSFFQLDDPVLSQIREEIENIDINTLTPVEALLKLNEIKKLTGVKV